MTLMISRSIRLKTLCSKPALVRRLHRWEAVCPFLAAMVLLVSVTGLRAQSAAPPSLLIPRGNTASEALRPLESGLVRGPVEVLRSRAVDFTRSLEDRIATRAGQASANAPSETPDFALNLFPDTYLPFFIDRIRRTTDGEGWTVFGTAGDLREGEGILTFYGGALSGSLRMANGEVYEIYVPPSGAGEVRQCVFQGFGGGTLPDYMRVPEEELAVRVPEGAARAAGKAEPAGGVAFRQAGGLSVVDVLVAYTTNAAVARGGLAGMLAHINQVIAESNQAFARSQAPIEIRLVHTVAVNYDDTSSALNYEVTLNALRSPTDGWMDSVHALRDHFGADMVSLWVNPPAPGATSFVVGQAYLMTAQPEGYAPFAFSVVNQRFAGGTSLTFPHELGHNLGLAHDRNTTNGSGLHPYSHGYQQRLLNPRFYTIMAYPSGCDGCSRIGNFSNPDVNHSSIPTGVEGEADTVRTLEFVAPLAAAWRPTTVGPTCSYSVNPDAVSIGPGGGMVTLAVSAGPGCEWTAQSGLDWVTVSSGATGNGNGSVALLVGANAGSGSRSGAVIVAGVPVTVVQTAVVVLPPLNVTPTSLSFAVQAGHEAEEPQSISFNTGSFATGASPVQISLSSDPPDWLSLSAETVVSPGEVQVATNARNLPPGEYTTTLWFSAPGTLKPTVGVPVTLSVRTGRFLASSTGFSMRVAQGVLFSTQSVLMKPPAGAGVTPSLRVLGGAWLSAATSLDGGLYRLEVRVSPGGLAKGLYDGMVEISCPGGGCELATLPVRLELVEPQSVGDGGEGPRIASGGVVNGASFQQGLASGAWMSIFGGNLAPTSRLWESRDFDGIVFPTALDGVRVSVDGIPAALQYISPGQVNFQAPSGLRGGWLPLEISTPQGTDRTYVFGAPEMPGFFQFAADGQLAALHPNGKPVTAKTGTGVGGVIGLPAAPGSSIAIYGTGFGPTDPPVPAGQIFTGAAPLVAAETLAVTIGGIPATVEFAGLSAAGLNQINVKIPPLASGLHSVLATVNGAPAQFLGRLAVE